jgi:hypothetical protein
MVRAEDGTDKLFDGDYTEGRILFGKPLDTTLLNVSGRRLTPTIATRTRDRACCVSRNERRGRAAWEIISD